MTVHVNILTACATTGSHGHQVLGPVPGGRMRSVSHTSPIAGGGGSIRGCRQGREKKVRKINVSSRNIKSCGIEYLY